MPMWTDPSESQKHIRRADELWQAMQPFSSGGAYVNYLENEGEDRVKAAYGTNYERLVKPTVRNQAVERVCWRAQDYAGAIQCNNSSTNHGLRNGERWVSRSSRQVQYH